MRYTPNLAAGQLTPFHVALGRFFYLETVPAGIVTVEFYRDEAKLVEEIVATTGGWRALPPGGFDRVELTSTVAQQVVFHVARGSIDNNVFSGAVNVTALTNNGALTHTAKQVTNASQVLLAANANRRFLMIQNQDAALDLYVKCDGAAAVVSNASIKIPAGQDWLPPGFVPTGEIRGIMSGATAANNVQLVEG